MSNALSEKRKTLNNSQNEVFEARVIANYGDPGLDEDYHFDILSRYVIVMLESVYRVPTRDKWNEMFAIVARPKHLWVDVSDGVASTPSAQKRIDPLGNTSIGLSSSFATAGIARMNFPYQLGETINVKKLAQPLTVGVSSFFTSQFSNYPLSIPYNDWHTEGSSTSYFQGDPVKIAGLKWKTIDQSPYPYVCQYFMRLWYHHYEAMMMNLSVTDANMTNYLKSVFDTTLADNSIFVGNGGYVFKGVQNVDFYSVDYEDVNAGNKQRLTASECMPLIVATPNTFPTPKTRAGGTVNYNPSYIVKS